MPGFVTTDSARFDSAADHYVLQIAEDARPGDVIGRLHMDGGTPGTSVYGVDGPDSDLISIDHDGTVRLADGVELDHESAPALNVRFNALFIGNDGSMLIDQSTPSRIAVSDVDEGISFDNTSPLVSIHDATAGGTEIGRFTATDGDGDRVTYHLLGDHADKFEIDADTGVLRVRPDTTFDAADFAGHPGGLLVEVVATSRHDPDDAAGVEMTASQPVLVTYTSNVDYQGPAVSGDDDVVALDIIDVPQDPTKPTMSFQYIDAKGMPTSTAKRFKAKENQIGIEIGSIHPTLPPEAELIFYAISAGTGMPADITDEFVNVTPTQHEIRLRHDTILDYETTPEIRLKINAVFSVNGIPKPKSEEFIIKVVDTEEPCLKFNGDNILQGSSPSGTYVGLANVQNTNERASFSLTKLDGVSPSDHFEINEETGHVSVRSGFDPQVTTTETVRITALLSHITLSLDKTFTINGIDVPDLAPQSVAAGSSLTHSLAARDGADGDTLSYQDTGGPLRTPYGSYEVTNGQLIYTPVAGHIGIDSFDVEITDGNGGVASASFQVTVGAPEMQINHRQTISDTSATPLDGAHGIEFVTVGSGASARQFLIAPARNDDAVSVYRLDPATGRLHHTSTVADSGTTPLDGVHEVASVTIKGVTHVYVAALDDDAISHFTLGGDGVLVPVSAMRDDSTLQLDGIKSLSRFSDGTGDYLITTASGDATASILRIGSDGHLSPLRTIDLPNEDGIGMVAEVDGKAFFIVSFPQQDEVRVYDLHSRDDNGAFTGAETHRIHDSDGTHDLLRTPLYGDSWQAGGKTFIVLPACRDHGMTTYELTSSGRLVLKDSVVDPSTTNDYRFTETMVADAFQIDGKHYIAVNGQHDTGFSLFSVDDDGQLEWVTSQTSVGAASDKSWVRFATVQQQHGTTLMVTADTGDDSLSLFALGYEDLSIGSVIPVTPEI